MSVISKIGVQLGKEVSIAETAVIRQNAIIGDGTCIESSVHIAEGVRIGRDCRIGPNVTILSNVTVGNNVIIHAGTVIGGEGFGYFWSGQHQQKVPQLGGVQIDDDVEIGCNTCIDRATFGSTIIGRGTKIDNLVQVAHNVTIGQSALLVSQSGVAGSASIGNGVVMGGQAAVADHVNVGDGAMIAGQSGVRGRVKPGAIVSGSPAIDHKTWLKASSAFPKLPQLVKQIRRLEKVVADLEEKTS